MRYTIKRECWNEKTYNGYTDNPYWRIDFRGLSYGLNDEGELWCINNSYINNFVIEDINIIITECKLNININLVV